MISSSSSSISPHTFQPQIMDWQPENNSHAHYNDKGNMLLPTVLSALVFVLLIIILVLIVGQMMLNSRSRHRSTSDLELMPLLVSQRRTVPVSGRH
ncbi:hypothetical protein P8452_48801 [Trifolium repens]|nr:hypothetical protein P8452_48801 [Trifolium repens]